MNQDFPKTKVYGALAIGLLSFGFAPILVKLAADYSAIQVATVRTVLAAILLLPVYLKYRDKHDEPVLKGEQKWMALSGILLGLHFICWIGSLYYTSVASASVLVAIHPIMLILAERMVFKVNFARTVWVGVIIAFLGSMFLGFADYRTESDFSNPVLGNALAFLAAAIFSVYFLIGRRVRKHHSWIGYVFPVYSWAGITCLVVMVLIEGFVIPMNSTLWLIGLALAVGPQIMGHGSLNYAVKYVSPTLLSTLILSEPLLASVMAWMIFSEMPSYLSVIAMLIILIGVGLSWRKKPTAPLPQID